MSEECEYNSGAVSPGLIWSVATLNPMWEKHHGNILPVMVIIQTAAKIFVVNLKRYSSCHKMNTITVMIFQDF